MLAQVMVDVESEYSGVVIDKLTGSRRGILVEMKDSYEGKVSQSQSKSAYSISFCCWLGSPLAFLICRIIVRLSGDMNVVIVIRLPPPIFLFPKDN